MRASAPKPIRTIPNFGPHASANVCFTELASPVDAYHSIAVGSKMAQIPIAMTSTKAMVNPILSFLSIARSSEI